MSDEDVSAFIREINEAEAAKALDVREFNPAASGEGQYYHAPWYAELLQCQHCACRLEAKRVVPGAGPSTAEILFLGRNPGKDEDQDGVPFIGRGGEELNHWLQILGLDRQKIVITNIVKCHTVKDREPKAGEIHVCTDRWLKQELLFLTQLQVIVPMGGAATKVVIGAHAQRPGKLNAYAHLVRHADSGRELHVLPLPHPAYLLRAPSKKDLLYRIVLPKIREYLAREVPAAYERARVR